MSSAEWFVGAVLAIFSWTGLAVGVAGIVLGIRMKHWSQSVRAMAIFVGIFVAEPGVHMAINLAYIVACTLLGWPVKVLWP